MPEGERIFSNPLAFLTNIMVDLKLDILVVPTYNTFTLGVFDASIYPTSPPIVSSPTIEITIPSLGEAILPFKVDDFNIFSSSSFGITDVCEPFSPLPDGVYTLNYTVAPAYENSVTKTFMRTEAIQEKFDKAFMKLDMMECSGGITSQQKVDLNNIYLFIQGAIAAANNCATNEANKLYAQANSMLDNLNKNNCNC
jgi:hypothetical protein